MDNFERQLEDGVTEENPHLWDFEPEESKTSLQGIPSSDCVLSREGLLFVTNIKKSSSESVHIIFHQGARYVWSRNGAVVRALASNQCVLRSIPRLCITCG